MYACVPTEWLLVGNIFGLLCSRCVASSVSGAFSSHCQLFDSYANTRIHIHIQDGFRSHNCDSNGNYDGSHTHIHSVIVTEVARTKDPCNRLYFSLSFFSSFFSFLPSIPYNNARNRYRLLIFQMHVFKLTTNIHRDCVAHTSFTYFTLDCHVTVITGG